MKKKYVYILAGATFCAGLGAGSGITFLRPRPQEITTTGPTDRPKAAPAAIHSPIALSRNSFQDNPFCEQLSEAVEKYACWVQQSAAGIRMTLGLDESSKNVIDAFKAIEAMNLVQTIASSARYSFRTSSGLPFSKPTMADQDQLLTDGYGICGNHQWLFVQIMRKAGVEAKPVDFYYTDKKGRRNSHAAAEIKIGAKWAYVDVTWGSYWVSNENHPESMLSLREIRNGDGTRISTNNSWYRTQLFHSSDNTNEIFSYLDAKDLQILHNKGGQLKISITNGKADFSDVPNYIGKTPHDSPMEMKVVGNFNPQKAIVDVAAVGGECSHSKLWVDDTAYTVKDGKTSIELKPDSLLEIKGSNNVCYAVISALTLPDEAHEAT